MIKKCIILGVSILFFSCKSKQVVVETPVRPIVEKPNNQVIDLYNNNKLDFKTIYIKSDVSYIKDKSETNVTAEIKIEKDKQILISIRFLGITMAKAYITPKGVGFYEKMNSSFFEGDFSFLSKFLGTDLNFDQVQKLLLGKAIFPLTEKDFQIQLQGSQYELIGKDNSRWAELFQIQANDYTLSKQKISQSNKNRAVEINYEHYQLIQEILLPKKLYIVAQNNDNNSEIQISYNQITLNEELSFPYSVPNGYKQIIIK